MKKIFAALIAVLIIVSQCSTYATEVDEGNLDVITEKYEFIFDHYELIPKSNSNDSNALVLIYDFKNIALGSSTAKGILSYRVYQNGIDRHTMGGVFSNLGDDIRTLLDSSIAMTKEGAELPVAFLFPLENLTDEIEVEIYDMTDHSSREPVAQAVIHPESYIQDGEAVTSEPEAEEDTSTTEETSPVVEDDTSDIEEATPAVVEDTVKESELDTSLQLRISELEGQVDSLETEMEEEKQKSTRLSNELEKAREKIVDLNSDAESLKTKNTGLENRLDAVTRNNEELRSENERLTKRVNRLQAKKDKLQEELKALEESTPEEQPEIPQDADGSETDTYEEEEEPRISEGAFDNNGYYEMVTDSSDYKLADIFYDQYDSYGSFNYDTVIAIENISTNYLYLSGCSIDLEDLDGHLVGTDSNMFIASCPSIIGPGEVGYFYNFLGTGIEADADKQYKLVIHPDIFKSSEKPVEYDISDLDFHNTSDGSIQITGRVINNTDKEDSYMYVNAVLFKNGKAVGITGVNVTDLMPGTPTSFSISGIMLGREALTADKVRIYAQKTSYQFDW